MAGSTYAVWEIPTLNESGQNRLVKGDVGVSHVANDESHQGETDGAHNPCDHRDGHHAAVRVSLPSTWEGSQGVRHISLLFSQKTNIIAIVLQSVEPDNEGGLRNGVSFSYLRGLNLRIAIAKRSHDG